MSTLGTLKSRIAGELDDSSISTEIAAAIQSAITHYERKKFWFNQQTITFPTVADQEYYGIADNSTIPNVLATMAMTFTQSSIKRPITGVSFTEIDRLQNGLVTGLPSLFAYFNKQYRLYRIPDQAYTVTAAVHYKLDTLTDDGQGNAWMQDAEELIRIRAKRNLARDKLWDTEMYERLREGEMEALDALQSETAKRISVRSLMTDYPTVGSRYNINFDG